MKKRIDKITREWLKEKGACKESYDWFDKQKDTSTKTITNKLYKEKKYDWCLWLLYRKDNRLKVLMWSLIILSYVLDALSIYLTNYAINTESNSAVAGVAAAGVAVAGAAGVAVAVAAAGVVAGVAVGVAVAVAVAGAVAGVAVAGVAGAVAGVAVAGVAGAVAGVAEKVLFRIFLKRLNK